MYIGRVKTRPYDEDGRNLQKCEMGNIKMALPQRKPMRLKGYDYSSAGCYFVTICTHEGLFLFGDGEKLNSFGEIVDCEIQKISSRYSDVKIDNYIIMPNHIHMILVLGCGEKAGKNPDLQQIMAQLKSGISREIRKTVSDLTVWQRSFHDHVIRTQKDYEKIWMYIETNPLRWDKDCFYIDPTMC